MLEEQMREMNEGGIGSFDVLDNGETTMATLVASDEETGPELEGLCRLFDLID